ncbi:MAG: XylR N-terminal domain-containing protein [Ignavibacteria bacterium]|nr:XylR N-terminal domain-containing protein [Ignavibacteria bacterium]
MKVTDFNLQKDLTFNLQTGNTVFHDSRLVIFSADAIGLLRQNLIELLGFERARRFFLRFGFQNGYSDFMQIKLNYSFDTEMDLLASGPVLHTWEGIVQATPKEISFDRDKGEFFFTGVWTNSYEAEQHLSYYHETSEPVCWSLMGYASGWCTAFFGSPLIAIEPVCMGKGDPHCEWKIQPPDKWGDEAKPYIDALSDLLNKR